jgi:hypothetical protein
LRTRRGRKRLASSSSIVPSPPIASETNSVFGCGPRKAMTNFCKNYVSSTEYNMSYDKYDERIVSRAYDSYDECVQLSLLGYFVKHEIITPEKAQILLRAGVDKPIQVTGIDTSSNISCYGPNDHGEKVTYGPATSVESKNTIGIFCDRKSEEGPGGTTVYREGSVAIAIKG